MKKTFCIQIFVASACIAFGSLAAAQTSPHAGAGHPTQTSGAKVDMHASMMAGMQEMQGTKPTGDVDRDFALLMRIHHLQAVDMAKAELKGGKSPELKAMAQKIIRDQQKEIAQFDKWLAKNK